MDRSEPDRRHERALEIIAANPQAFIDGLDHPMDVALEITLLRNGMAVKKNDSRPRRGDVAAVTETDVRLIMLNGDLRIIECKLKSDSKYRRRARVQLDKARGWYRKHLGISPEKIYTHAVFVDDPKYKEFFKNL